MRKSIVERKTKETDIILELNIDGSGVSKIKTGINFLDHMLELFSKHGLFDLNLTAKGDLKVDQHHTVEDVGIALGDAFKKALGDKKGINRAGYFVMPMDESLAIFSIDIGGRPYLKFDVEFKNLKIGDLDSELVHDFFEGFANNIGANVHAILQYGRTDHHRCEAVFKSFGRSLAMACSKNPRAKGSIPSTKGIL